MTEQHRALWMRRAIALLKHPELTRAEVIRRLTLEMAEVYGSDGAAHAYRNQAEHYVELVADSPPNPTGR